jgi:hypothetical protein
MKACVIVGYTFNADIYCDGICILRALGEIGPRVYARVSQWTTMDEYRAQVGKTNRTLARLFNGEIQTEAILGVIAERRGIEKDNEHTYDSGDFPKVIFASEEFPDYCPRCALCSGVLDGFDPADYETESDD